MNAMRKIPPYRNGTDMNVSSRMTQHPTNHRTFKPILLGLLTAQLIATGFVYLSNHHMLSVAETLVKTGYFPIPAGTVMAQLDGLGASLRGGLFFTFSIGTGLALTAWTACQIWNLLFKRHPLVWVCLSVIWTVLLVWINSKGLVLFPTLFTLCVPMVTGWITIRSIGRSRRSAPKWWYVPVVTLLLLTALWTTQLNNHLFVTIRDHILLSNPIGRSVNDFYYRNTLYAAEAFKSFAQKTIRTCKMVGFEQGDRTKLVVKYLAQRDVLVIPEVAEPDLVLTATNENLSLATADGRRIDTRFEDFLSDPNPWLQKFSQASDHYGPFRRITLIGLLLGFPILLYIFIFDLFNTAFGSAFEQDNGRLLASALCLIIGVLLFLPMLNARPKQITRDGLGKALASDQWPRRVAALKFCENNHVDIARYPFYSKILNSTRVVERYWLARALAKSRTASAYSSLLLLLHDAHPNVVCQAFYALGESRRPGAIHAIQRKILDLDHWYAQWYGYRALRKLGWYQRRSK
jgi:hypothetical protein